MLYLRPIIGLGVVTKWHFWVEFVALSLSQVLICFSNELFLVFGLCCLRTFLEQFIWVMDSIVYAQFNFWVCSFCRDTYWNQVVYIGFLPLYNSEKSREIGKREESLEIGSGHVGQALPAFLFHFILAWNGTFIKLIKIQFSLWGTLLNLPKM